MKQEVFFLTSRNHLIKFGMKASFSNQKVMAFQDLLVLTGSYLSNHKQLVVLNGKSSIWSSFSVGVPQGSVLFLVHINGPVENISSDAKLFADDTSLLTIVYDEVK